MTSVEPYAAHRAVWWQEVVCTMVTCSLLLKLPKLAAGSNHDLHSFLLLPDRSTFNGMDTQRAPPPCV